MATLVAVNPEVVGKGTAMPTGTYAILSGQSWKAGQFLFLDTNGLLKACASDAASGTGGIKFLALADQTDPGNSTTDIEVGLITRDTIFEMNELDGSVTVSNRGQFYALDVTSNVCTVDVGDTGNDALEIVALGGDFSPAEYNNSDTKAKVHCKILTVALEAAPA